MKPTFHPKVILITGCSSGFGLLMAARFASKGHKVYATMRDTRKKEALLNELKKRGAQAEILMMDVTNNKEIFTVINKIGIDYGYVDVLINNAGYGIGGFFEDLTEEEIRKQMDTNFFGVQNVIRATLPLMRPRKKGTIINISSIAGLYTSPAFSAYNTSKWALEAFSESLRYELNPFGIDVCLIEPGSYRTKIFEENARYAKNFDNPESPYYQMSQRLKKRLKEHVSDLHKDPEEIAILAEKLITVNNPPLRNIPDIEAKTLYFLRRLLPTNIFMHLLYKIFSKEFNNKKKGI
ncbi:MAG TPA: SDR family oxidoreductase [Candidatus Omnitrophota bacterium]|nr:SDR family oxidoreductase [Candidatus Omnitrophota bacterium]